jgi:hypothetical protein
MIAVSLNVTMSNPLHHHVTVMQALREFPTVEENVAGPKKKHPVEINPQLVTNIMYIA